MLVLALKIKGDGIFTWQQESASGLNMEGVSVIQTTLGRGAIA